MHHLYSPHQSMYPFVSILGQGFNRLMDHTNRQGKRTCCTSFLSLLCVSVIGLFPACFPDRDTIHSLLPITSSMSFPMTTMLLHRDLYLRMVFFTKVRDVTDFHQYAR